jgi:hypothetical protein
VFKGMFVSYGSPDTSEFTLKYAAFCNTTSHQILTSMFSWLQHIYYKAYEVIFCGTLLCKSLQIIFITFLSTQNYSQKME